MQSEGVLCSVSSSSGWEQAVAVLDAEGFEVDYASPGVTEPHSAAQM